MNKSSKIYVAGNTGLVGSSIIRNLKAKGYSNLVFTPYPEYDLMDQKVVADFFKKEKPEYVFLAAAKVGGIMANTTYRAQFVYENTQIQSNVIHQSYVNNVKKLLFLGSSCIYPKICPQPMKEEYLLTGELEYTNEPYAVAKISGIKMCEGYNLQYGTNFISVMPTNIYGPNDNYDLEKSHVLPAIIRKIYLAKCLENRDFDSIKKDFEKRPVGIAVGGKEEIVKILDKYGISCDAGKKVVLRLWGTGKPKREFLYSDDLADACVFVMERIDFKDAIDKKNEEIRNSHINIGTGKDITIKELAELIKSIIGFKGEIEWDHDKPDGTPQKLLDVTKINKLGWKEKVSLKEGIKKVYEGYISA